MANPANYAISLGLLIAVLAAILAATRRTPAMAGTGLPLLAAAGGRQPARRTGTSRAAARKGTGNGKANGNGKATRAGNGQTTAAPARTPRRAKADTTSTAPAVNPVSGTERLAPGKLQEQVLAYLAAHAGEELSPSQIAKALGRSSGAVGNGLESLAKEGEVQKTRQEPRRFMIPARAKRNGTGKRNGTSQAAAPATPKPTRANRATRAKAGNGPTATTGKGGNGNGGNGSKAEPPASPASAAKPTERKPTTRPGRNGKAGAAADEATATGT